nr:putative disease resistance rpp13-like protein 1 [Quercus suber]
MADPTSFVIKPILDFVINTTTSLIKEEYSLVHGVKEDIENLKSRLTSIQAVVEDAENKQVNDPRLKDWLGKLQEAASDAEDILDTFATKAYLWKQKQKERIFKSLPSKSKTSYKRDAAQKIKKLSERFDRIAQQKEDFHLDIKVNGGETGDSLSSQRLKVLEDIGREIVRKCKGLPLAVKAMGGLLRGCVDDVNKWRQIQSSEIWEIEDQNSGNDKPKILAILKLSYDHLPSHLKRCFSYCSLFPKAYTFHKEELVKLWISQRFIQAQRRGTEEETGIAYFDELLIRSFFQVSVIEVRIFFVNNKKY